MPVKSKLFSSRLGSPTLLLQHSHAKSRAGVGEQEWGYRGYFSAIYEATAEGCDLTDVSLGSAPLRASGVERGSCRPPFTSVADPVLSQPGGVNQKLAL